LTENPGVRSSILRGGTSYLVNGYSKLQISRSSALGWPFSFAQEL
jgi:hypothetical protein